MTVFFNVHFLAVFVAALASFVVGWVWYSPLAFGRVWARLSGVSMTSSSRQAMVRAMVTSIIGGLAGAFVKAWALAIILKLSIAFFILSSSPDSLPTLGGVAMCAGIVAAVGLLFPQILGSTLWEGKSWKLFLLNAAWTVVEVAVMLVIITVWMF